MEYTYKQNPQKESEIMNQIYDEEFISSINSLSSSIKEYFNTTKININNLKIGADSISDQIIYSRTLLNEALRNFTNTMKYSIVHSQNEIAMKEKILSVSERMERLIEMKVNILNDIKTFETASYNFYDKAKIIFKKMKNIRDKNIEKISHSRYISYFNSPLENKFKSTNISNQYSLNTSTNYDIKKEDLLIKRNEQLVSENAVIKYQYNKLLEEVEQLKANVNKEKKECNVDNDIPEVRNKQFDTIANNDNNNINKRNKIVVGIKNKLNINHGILKSLQKNNNFITLQINNKNRNYSASQSQSNSLNKYKNKNDYKKNISLKETYNNQSNLKSKNTQSNPITHCVTTENSLNTTLNKNNKNISLINMIKNDSFGRNNLLLNNYIKKSNSINKKTSSKTKPEINKNRNNSNFLLTTNNSNNNSQSKNNSVNMLTVSIQSNQSNEQCNVINNSFSNNVLNTNLPSLVLAFLEQMDQLQSAISQRINKENVRDMKLNFGKKKKELIKICDNLIKNMSYNGNNCRTTCLTTTNNSLNNSPRISNKIPFKSQNISNAIKEKPMKDNISQDTSNITLNITQNNIEEKVKELEKQVEDYKKEIELKNDDIKKIKSDIELKEEKIKNEKLISKLCEEKLNQEKEENKKKEEELINLNKKIDVFEKTEKQHLNKINEFEKQNKKLIDNEKLLENNNNNLNNEIQSLKQEIQKTKNDLNEQHQNYIKQKETEINALELKIKDNNNNIINITNNNELIIKEKNNKINELLAVIKDLKTNINNNTNNNTNNNKEIEQLKEELNSYQTKATDFKKENKILKNKIAEIKVEYLSKKDEELETIKKDLIKLNDETGIKLNTILSQNENEKSEIEKNIEFNLKQEFKMHNNKLDLCDIIDKIKQYSDELSNINKDLETRVTLASEPTENIANENIKLKKENEKLKVIILSIQGKDFLSSRNDKLKNKLNLDINNEKSINNIIEQNSKFLDDELSSLSGIFNDDNKKDEFNVYTNKDNIIK